MFFSKYFAIGIISCFNSLGVHKHPTLRKYHKYIFDKVLGKKVLKLKHEGQLCQIRSNLLQEIISNGFAQGALPSDMHSKLEVVRRYVDKVRAEPSAIIKVSKEYLKRVDPFKSNEIANLSMKIVLDDFFVSIVEEYLGERPLLTDITILISASTDENFSGSQLFHCDFDDSKNVKIFIPLGPVTDKSGPLQAIPKSATLFAKEKYGYRCGTLSVSGIPSHSDDWESLSRESPSSFTGDMGSFVLIDTDNCFHRGSRKAEEERIMLYAHFNTRSSYRHPPFNRIFPLGRLIDLSSPLYRKSINVVSPEKNDLLLNA